ncbi:MAG: DNA cytosine methyltransferase [Oscillospiraceae bacterium]|nr:DNA cytosine methyltransferase [Oscillospiraceae bacterium]
MVSLYDGVSCGRLALEKAGYAVSHYEAFEFNKSARAISRYRYPHIVHHGDVLDADFRQFIDYDIVMGGSPYIFWSAAKQNQEVDKDGMGWKLFMRFVDAIWQIQPRYFLYENIAAMPSNIKEFISDELGCEPIPINSALVSAHNQNRLYWTNIEGVAQPYDKGILLKDILDCGLSPLDKINLADSDYILRKLSVVEAERCQTMPDNYTAFGIDDSGKTVNISNSQRYKVIGNGWTVDVISRILSHMNGGDF